MGKLGSLCVLFALSLTAYGQTAKYNQKLADSLGADEYGMKSYVFVLLKSGSNTSIVGKERDSLFGLHMKNIAHMEELGKLAVAGPFMKNDHAYRGLFILNVKTIAEAEELLKNDPTITSNILSVEYTQWYGSAALPLYLDKHSEVQKKSF